MGVVCIGIMGLGMMAGAGAALGTWRYLVTPAGGREVVSFTVQPGMRLRHVLEVLAAQRVLDYPWWLYGYARLRGQTGVQAGQYEIQAHQTPQQILSMLQQGQVKLESFTVPEGFNRWQIRDMLVQSNWMTAQEFDALCDDTIFLKAHRIPGPSCEGYLFPETYKLARWVPASQLLGTMFKAYQHALAGITRRQGWGPLGLSERQFTTLASIVEKETGQDNERPRVACVFYNRLQAKPVWRLETDPTVVYAALLADPLFKGRLTRRLLNQESPYNTYRTYGIPPGPICSPGRAALEAVAQPDACNDFFFVSTNHGQHVFCSTLACHQKAVKKWQIDYFRKLPFSARAF